MQRYEYHRREWDNHGSIPELIPFPKIKTFKDHAVPVSMSPDAEAGPVTPVGFPPHRWLLLLGDGILVCFAIALSIGIRINFSAGTIMAYSIEPSITLLLYPLMLYIFDLYNVERLFRSWETAFRSAIAIGLGTGLAVFIFYLMPIGPYGRGIMILVAVLAWYFLNIWRWGYGIIFQKSKQKLPVLILGAGICGDTICRLLRSPLSPYDVRGFIDDDPTMVQEEGTPAIMGGSDRLIDIATKEGVHTVVLAIPRNRSEALIRNILHARLKGINIFDMADIYESLTGRIPVRNIGDQWLLFAQGFYLLHADYVQKLKRLMDFIASGLILLMMSPILGLALLAIRIDSPGPFFYTQKRVGKDREIFTIYKFRSMQYMAENGTAEWAKEKDPRVTRVGKILRLTHIDELPQIWNIFKGEMSLVGPRPERPEFVEILEKELPYYFVRHSVKPGLTGWAQINYRYGASVEDSHNKLEYDLYYIKNMSLFLDLQILLRTVGVVLLKDGAR